MRSVHKSDQGVFRIYRRAENIPCTDLIRLSGTLGINLFSIFREHEAMAGIPDPLVRELEEKVNDLLLELDVKKRMVSDADRQIKNLERLVEIQDEKIKSLQKQLTDKQGEH